MFFASLLIFTNSAIFGIDYGSEYIKVGMALLGKHVHIALNQQSKRLSPSYFAFWNISNPRGSNPSGHWELKDLSSCSWSFLDAAKSHTNRFPNNGIQGLSPLLETEHGFKKREVLALVLRHLISTVDSGNWKPEQATLVFTVEPVFPYEERIAISEAVKLTNATLAGIIDSPTAAANVYGLEKRSLFVGKPKTVTFLDIGATHTWISIFKFSLIGDNQDIDELAVSYNYSLGGNLIDHKISNRLIDVFYEKNKVNITTERGRRQFLEEARRVKELLSINDFVDVRMEDVIDDYGLYYQFSRSEMEKIITEFNESLRNLFLDVTSKANLTINEIDSIELLGGSTRVPLIKQIIMNISGMTKLNRTMNSDEAMALGATYVGASGSGAFIVKTVKTNPFTLINSSVLLPNGEKRGLYETESRTTDEPRILLDVSECRVNGGTFTILAGNNDTALETFVITIPQDYDDNEEVQLNFGFNSLSVPSLINATINQKRKLRVIRTKPEWMLSDEEMLYSQQFIKKMDNILKKRRKLQQNKNEFESYLYKIKDRLELDEDFKNVLSSDERTKLGILLSEDMKWFEDTVNPTSKQISQKHSDLKKITREPEIRAEQLKKRIPAFKNLNATLGTIFNSLNATWPTFRPWLPKDKVESLWILYNSTLQWFQEKWKLQEQASLTDNPVVMAYEIVNKQKNLEKLYNQLKNLDPPTPTPKPKLKKSAKPKPKKNLTNTDAENITRVQTDTENKTQTEAKDNEL